MESNIVYFNSATQPFGDHTAAIQLNHWAVYNAPRPIPGEITFQGEFRHGIFYAAGPLDRYARAWDELDAWPVELVSNKEIVDRLTAMAKARNTTLVEVLEYADLPELARQCGLPWHDIPPSTPPSDDHMTALAARTRPAFHLQPPCFHLYPRPVPAETSMCESSTVDARFVTQITVRDPDSNGPVEMEVWKDPTSGALFAIDASFLEAVAEEIPSPFNPDVTLHLREDALATLSRHPSYRHDPPVQPPGSPSLIDVGRCLAPLYDDLQGDAKNP